MLEFPEPLFESPLLPTPKLCLMCGKKLAVAALYSTTPCIILPLCSRCVDGWRWSSYNALKKINVKKLIINIIKYKIFHPFSKPSIITIYNDIQVFKKWTALTKRVMKKMKENK